MCQLPPRILPWGCSLPATDRRVAQWLKRFAGPYLLGAAHLGGFKASFRPADTVPARREMGARPRGQRLTAIDKSAFLGSWSRCGAAAVLATIGGAAPNQS